MKDWQIAVMIVIVFVFVIVAIVLSILLWKCWYGPYRTKHRKDEKYITNNDNTTNHHGAHRVFVVNGVSYTTKPSEHVLYFLDMAQHLQHIDFKKHQVATGGALQWTIANLCHLQQPETLSLTYIKIAMVGAQPQVELVEMDLDGLVRSDAELPRRLYHTGERPLLLGRLGTPVAVPPDFLAALLALAQGSNAALHANNVDIEINRQPQPQQYLTQVAAAPPPPAQVSGQPVDFRFESAGGGYGAAPVVDMNMVRADPTGQVPIPTVLPARAHITASTPVFLTAATYYLQPLAAAGAYVASTPMQDYPTTVLLEAAMSGETSPTVYPTQGPLAGSRIDVMAAQGTAVVRSPGIPERVLVRRRVGELSYTIDRTTSSQWQRFTGPLRLPPGRWCLRARCSTADGSSSSDCAKVFTVDVL